MRGSPACEHGDVADQRITVATLDYLSNITAEIASPTLISETYAAEIADLSMRDGMTDLYNHSSCYELLELEFRVCVHALERRSGCQLPALAAAAPRVGEGPRPLGQRESCKRIGALVAGLVAQSPVCTTQEFTYSDGPDDGHGG
jgi:hypothetical protein